MKIAIVKLSAMGDIVHAMVALQFLKALEPDMEIDWVVEKAFAEVLRHNPDIDRILTVNLKALKRDKAAIFSEISKVRGFAKKDYDWVIDAQGLLKSAITARLLGGRVAGFDKDSIREKLASCFYSTKVHCPYDANTIDRNATVLSRPLGFKITPEQILQKQAFLHFADDNPALDDYLSNSKKNLLFVIGSTWESRNYPKEKFLQIAKQLQQNTLVVWGSEAERQKAEWIAERSDHVRVLPKLSLNDLKALIAKADLTLGNDTGPTHMAWGLNRPSIVLFGCTPVSRVYQTEINKVIKSPSEVNPYKLNKEDFSIQEIEAGKVVEMATELLEG